MDTVGITESIPTDGYHIYIRCFLWNAHVYLIIYICIICCDVRVGKADIKTPRSNHSRLFLVDVQCMSSMKSKNTNYSSCKVSCMNRSRHLDEMLG